MTKAYDVIIVGAGIVGQSLAIGLANEALNVALIDAGTEPQPTEMTTNKVEPLVYGARVSAISSASQALLVSLGAWNNIARMQAYTHMHVWDTDGFGEIEFDIHSLPSAGKPKTALGHIIENDVMNAALYAKLSTYSNVDCFFNATVTELKSTFSEAQVCVRLANNKHFTAQAKLLIGADGANSKVRASFGFAHTFWDYDHYAIVANVTTEHPHNNTARQAFTPFGPLAFLPLPDAHQSSIVFSQQSERAMALMAQDTEAFEQVLQVAINNYYGKVQLNTQRVSFPLQMRYARQWTCKHVAIMGDAAHTIHPLAGQGANLGLADVQTMLEIVAAHKDTLGEVAMLRKYERCRKAHAMKVIASMEGFKQLFDGEHSVKKMLRNIGLLSANKLPAIKAFFIEQAMG